MPLPLTGDYPLAPGYSWQPVLGGPPEGPLAPVGLLLLHPHAATGAECSCVLYLAGMRAVAGAPDGPEVTALAADPLTLAETVTCPECGLAGQISAGDWREE